MEQAIEYTAESVKALDINEIISLIERKTGEPVPVAAKAKWAMMHGCARAGSSLAVIDMERGESHNDTFDYKELAKIFNGPDVEMELRPALTVLIPDTEHFLKAWKAAQEIGGETFSRFQKQLMGLIHWAVIDYRDKLKIMPDGKHCFYFAMEKDGQFCMNGGLIKHGEEKEAYWSIHT